MNKKINTQIIRSSRKKSFKGRNLKKSIKIFQNKNIVNYSLFRMENI